MPVAIYKLASVIMLLIVSSASYSTLRNEFQDQQNPDVEEIDEEVRNIINDIRDTWRELLDSKAWFLITTKMTEIYCPGGVCDQTSRMFDYTYIFFSQGAVFEPKRPNCVNCTVVWKGEKLFCEKNPWLFKPNPLGLEDSDGFVKFSTRLQSLSFRWNRARAFESGPLEWPKFEVNFKTGQCFLKESLRKEVEECKVHNMERVETFIKTRRGDLSQIKTLKRSLIPSDKGWETCRLD